MAMGSGVVHRRGGKGQRRGSRGREGVGASGRMVPLVGPDEVRAVGGLMPRSRRAGPRAASGAFGAMAVGVGGLGPLRLAVRLPARLRGLLRRGPQAGVTLLAPCRDVHTLGMRHPIDVAFLDVTGRVVEAQRAVAPGRRLRCAGAVAALERFAGEGPWLREGDKVEMAVARRSPR